MSNETIHVVYEYLGSFAGLDYYHETLLYTNANGQQFLATAGPTGSPPPENSNSYNVSQAASAAANSTSSVYGSLDTKTGAISTFEDQWVKQLLGTPQNPNPSEVVATGADLSQQWNNIVQTEQQIANRGLPYSPVTQNSNSVASAALAAAGIAPPTDNGPGSDHWTPAADNLLDVPPLTPQWAQDYQDFLNQEQICRIVDPVVSTSYTSSQIWVPRRDPLVFDLDGDGLETTALNTSNPILFDHDGDGIKTATGWIGSDDGFLVLDRNNNGTIDSGRELFGDATLIPDGQGGQRNAIDGFEALAAQDTNNDGLVNSSDTNFASLRIWQDLNQDGLSQANELFTLAQKDIVAITVAKTENNTVLPNGNVIADLGTYIKSDGTTALTPEAQTLPTMQGSGQVRELCEAA
ncbi:MAG: Hemolysin-type calcium-binding region [Gammaproteobacteria bacterium]|nr:MAG: Hemolysin-type calcium-binding region [Gammaproteobacteria bacterium]